MKNKTPFQIQDPDTVTQTLAAHANQFLTVHQIPATPANYAIAYEYAAKRHAELNHEIDHHLERCDNLDGYFLGELFERFFVQEQERELDGHVDDIQQIITQLLQGVSEHTQGFEDYETLLAQQIDQLQLNPELAHLRTIVANLLQATQQAHHNSSQLRSHLDQSREEIEQLQAELEEVRQEAYTDALTGLYNRKALANRLDQLLEEAPVPERPLSLLMLDIDHFKLFNDRYGHLIGDEVIRRVAGILKRHAEGEKMAARFGGEEFTLVIPGGDIEQALNLAETIHDAVAKLVLIRKKDKARLPGISISVGAASIRQGEGPEELLERADQALYLAKHQGRDQVVSERQLAQAC